MSKTVSKRKGCAAGGTALRLRPLCAAIVAVMPALAGADIVPDQTAAQRATMGQTANGTPMVNIVDPNQRGISHNKFQSFNVGNGGVVFNNSMNNGVSAIGGLAMKNANLNNEARAIIGEVTGSGRSALNGAMEIFGRKADLIIANPNGIQVNGASTVNANSLTLSTGRVLGQPDGSVRLGVEDGTVRIDGAGLSTEGLTYFDVISRTAELNGEIKGPADIKVVAGKTEYDPATRTHVATQGATAGQAIAIDGSQLGSMYGGRIELVATDSGAGVRHQGSLVGNNGISVTADGDIVIGAAQSRQGRIDIAGRNVTVTGTSSTGAVGLTSAGDIAIRALQTVGLHADLLAQNGTVTIDASTLVQHAAKILAARGEGGAVAVPGVRISVGDYRIEGTLYATNAAGERIDGATVLLEDGNYVVRDSEGRVVDGARVASTAQVETTSGAVSIAAGNVSVDGGVVVANGGALEINVAGMLRNEGLLSASDAVALTAGTMENKGVATGADLTVRVDSLANTGKLSANGELVIDASQSIDNAGNILAGGTLTVEGVRELVNRDGGWMQGNTVALRDIETLTNRDKGVLVAVNQMSLDGIGSIANDDAILQGNNVQVTNAGTVTNENGAVIQAAQSLTIDGADSLSNDKSRLVAGGALGIHDVTAIDNKNDALIQAGQSLTIDSADSLSNDNAMLAAGGMLTVRDVKRIDNNAGTIAADGNVAIERAQELVNRNAARISAARDMAIAQVGTVSNTGANVYADGSVTISGATAVGNSDGGVIGAGGALDIGAQTLDNRGKDSLLQGATGATFVADSIDNAEGAAMISGDTLRIEADTVTNASQGVIHGETGASITTVGALVNTGAGTQMGSGGTLEITADTVSNDNGAMIYGASAATIDAGSVRNQDGSTIVATDGKLTIHAKYLIENAASGIVGAEIELATQSLSNLRNGQIESDGNATVDVNTINNREGQIWAGRTLDVNVRENLIFGQNAGTLNAGELLKASTTRNVQVMSALENAGAIDLHADGDLVNRSAIISGRGVTLSAANIENTANSLIWAMQDVSLDAARGTIRNARNGNILSQGTMSLVADTIVNEAGSIRSEGNMSIDARDLKNLSAYANTEATMGPVTTEMGYAEYPKGLWDTMEFKLYITLPTLSSGIALDKSAEISAGGDLRINQKGLYSANATRDGVDEFDSVLNEGGIISAGGNLYIKGDVVNQPKFNAIDMAQLVVDRLSQPITLWTYWLPDMTFTSLYEMLDFFYGKADAGQYMLGASDTAKWQMGQGANSRRDAGEPQSAFRGMTGATLNLIMSTLFGPTWKSMSQSDMEARWTALKQDDSQELRNSKYYFLPQEKGAISAGGNITHEGGSFTNGIGGVQVENKRIEVTIGDQTIPVVAPAYDVAVNLKKFEELAMGISTLPALKDLVAIHGMFQVSAAWLAQQSGHVLPGSQTANVVPMYETRLTFIDQSRFYGTDYFFNQIGYDPTVPANVIGDNYFINELVRRQLNDAVGAFFAIRDGVEGEGMVKMLMDNAGKVNAAGGNPLGLEVGKALTQEQMSALDTDIIWYVSESINGVDVLVPRVYLAPKTIAEMRDGEGRGAAIVNAGGSISIDAGKVTNASGAIVAGKDVSLRARGDVVNVSAGMSGGIAAGGNVSMISAKGDVLNNGASIAAKGNVELSAENGKVNIAASVGHDSDGKHKIHEFDDGITAGGNVTVTGASVNLQSAEITAGKNATITATEGSVTSQEMHQVDANFQRDFTGKGINYVSVEKTEASAHGVGSNIKAGGTLTMAAKEDIVLEGGNYAAARGVMEAGGNVDVKTSTDYAYANEETTVSQFTWGAGAKAMGYEANVSGGTMDGTTSYAGRSSRDNPADDGQSNSSNGRKPGRAPIDESAGAKFGYSKTTDSTTSQSKTHQNAALSFGDGGLSMTGQTVDFGGADITTPGALNVAADDIKTTKYVDESSVKQSHSELFVGIKAEGHSSIADAANKYGELGAKADQDGNATDGGMTTLQVLGDVSNLVFNDLAGGSVSIGMETSKTIGSATRKSENVNHIDVGSMTLIARNDIELNGVDIQAGEANLDAGGDIAMRSAKTWTESQSSTDSYKAQLSGGASVSVTGAGAGASLDFSGSYDTSARSSLEHTNGSLNADKITIKSGGDTTLAGANVTGNDVSVKTGGNLNVESVQDTVDYDREKANWGVSIGAAISSSGGIMPTLSVDGGGGGEFRDERTTKAQSGIVAKHSLDVDTAGDLNLTGGHLISESGTGKVDVGGAVNATSLTDIVEQDGGYGGGGGGISRSGLGTINAYGETIDEIHKETRQQATIAGVALNTDGVNGDLNRDAARTSEVVRDETISGNQISFTVGIGDIADVLGKSKGSYNVKPSDDGGDGRRPTPSDQSRNQDQQPGQTRDPGNDTYEPLGPRTRPDAVDPTYAEAGDGGNRSRDSHVYEEIPDVSAKPASAAEPHYDVLEPEGNGAGRQYQDNDIYDSADNRTRPDADRDSHIYEEVLPLREQVVVDKAPADMARSEAAPRQTPDAAMARDGRVTDRTETQAADSRPVDTVAPQQAQPTAVPKVAPTPDSAPRKKWEVKEPQRIVLSAGSSTAKPGFVQPSRMNTNTGKSTDAIGDRAGDPTVLSPGSSSALPGFVQPRTVTPKVTYMPLYNTLPQQ